MAVAEATVEGRRPSIASMRTWMTSADASLVNASATMTLVGQWLSLTLPCLPSSNKRFARAAK